MRIHRILAGAVALAVAVGCSDNPTEADGHADELTVELSFTPDHVHTLSAVTFQATVRDGHGDLVTDFDTLRVERKAEGSDTWRTAADLALMGGVWTGEYSFSSSGEYHLRVMGQRIGHAMEQIPFTDPLMEHMDVGRAHVEVGDVRIEFESFPGHIHEGDQVTFRFWAMEAEPDASGSRPPLGGLDAEIQCGDPASGTELHVATESETGVYEATHTFAGAGDASAKIVLTTPSGPVEATFEFHVVHAH